MSSNRIIRLFKERNETIKNLISKVFLENRDLISIQNELVNINFYNSSMFKAAFVVFKDHVDVDSMVSSKNNKAGYCLQLKINESLISNLKSPAQLNLYRNKFLEEYLAIEKRNIYNTIKIYEHSYPDLNQQYKGIFSTINNEANDATNLKQISLLSKQLDNLKEEIKDLYRSIESTEMRSSNSNESSQLSRYSDTSSLVEEEVEHKNDGPSEARNSEINPKNNKEADFDIEVKKIAIRLANPLKRREYIKECQDQAKEHGEKNVRFIEYSYENKVIGRVSEQDKARLDELLANKLQQEESQQKPRIK